MSKYGKDAAVVTGGAGFIGSRLVRKLVDAGQSVRVLDDFSTGSRDNLSDCPGSVDLFQLDVSTDPILKCFADIDVVYHLAAWPSVAGSMKRPAESVRNDVLATSRVLDATRVAGVRKVVFTSSCAVYGDGAAGSLRGEPLQGYILPAPTNPYAAAKLCGEVLCRSFSRAFSFSTAVLRLYNVYGPGQPSEGAYAGVIPAFARAMLDGVRPTIYGDGHQTRDFIHVDDAVDALVATGAERWSSRGSSLADVGTGGTTTVLALVAILNEMLGTSIEPNFARSRRGDVRYSRASTVRGLYGKTSLRDGLRGVLDWLKEGKRC